MDPFALAVAIVGLSTGASGVALLVRRQALVSATLLVVAGSAWTAAAMLLASGHDDSAALLGVLAVSLLAPAALATYPRLRWRHPVDFVSLVVILGCGVVGVAYADPGVTGLMGLIQGCALLVHTWWRIEVAADRERRALVWMSLALVLTGLLYFFAAFSTEGFASDTVPSLATAVFALVGPAMYVGATLPDLVDVRGLVVRTVVHGAALVTVMSLFMLALALLDALGADRLNTGAEALVAALAATAYHPTCVLLRGVVDQLLFGERPDPLGAASAVAGRIGEDPLIALRAIREALVVPYAALVVDGAPLAASGAETTHTRTLDLDGAGELVVGLRPGDLSFSAGDEQVLRLTVPLLAQTLRSRALAEDLIESRGQGPRAQGLGQQRDGQPQHLLVTG